MRRMSKEPDKMLSKRAPTPEDPEFAVLSAQVQLVLFMVSCADPLLRDVHLLGLV